MLGIGIIGCGSIALKRHAVEYSQNKDCKIIGCYDLKKERSEKLAKEFNCKVYQSRDELLNDKSIDAVSICSANAFHKEDTIKALESGKHVLCEKPMAINLVDAIEMVEASKKVNKKLLIAHNQRLTTAHKKVKEIIESSELGKVLTFSSVFGHGGPESWSQDKSANTWFFKKDIAKFGSILDLGIHKIDLINFFIDSDVKKVYSVMKVLDKKFEDGTKIEVDDNSMQIIEFKNGVFGTVTTSWTHYAFENNQTYIYLEKGIIKLYVDKKYPLVVSHNDGRVENYEYDAIQTNDSQTNTGVIDLFIESIKTYENTVLDAENIIKSMKIVFACTESAEKGKPIELI